MKIIALTIAFALFASACGKTTKKLSDTQIQKLKEFSASASEVNDVANEQGIHAPAPTARTQDTIQSAFIYFAADSATKEDNPTKMRKMVKQAIADKLCSMKASTTAAGSQISFGNASGSGIDLVGSNSCPATFTISLLSTGTPVIASNKKSSSKKMTIIYEANTAKFKELTDIDKFDFSADIAFELTELNRLESTLKSKLSGSGSVHSQKMGTVGISLTSKSEITSNSDKPEDATISGNSSMRLDFTDFSVQLDAELKDNVISYTLNGDKVSEAQVSEYFSGLAPSKSTASVGR